MSHILSALQAFRSVLWKKDIYPETIEIYEKKDSYGSHSSWGLVNAILHLGMPILKPGTLKVEDSAFVAMANGAFIDGEDIEVNGTFTVKGDSVISLSYVYNNETKGRYQVEYEYKKDSQSDLPFLYRKYLLLAGQRTSMGTGIVGFYNRNIVGYSDSLFNPTNRIAVNDLTILQHRGGEIYRIQNDVIKLVRELRDR